MSLSQIFRYFKVYYIVQIKLILIQEPSASLKINIFWYIESLRLYYQSFFSCYIRGHPIITFSQNDQSLSPSPLLAPNQFWKPPLLRTFKTLHQPPSPSPPSLFPFHTHTHAHHHHHPYQNNKSCYFIDS